MNRKTCIPDGLHSYIFFAAGTAMPKVVLTALLALALNSPAVAGFEVEKSVYRMDRVEAAQSEAKSEGELITFMFSDENTTCSLCSGSSLAMMDSLGKKSVVIYVDAKKDWKKLPRLVQTALSKPEAGKYIPKSVVVDADISKVIAIVPYARGSEQEKLIKTARKVMKEATPKRPPLRRPLGAARASRLQTLPRDESREMRTWTSRTGSQVTAALVQESGGYLFLKKEDSSSLKILLSRLSDEDHEYIQKLKETAAEKAETANSRDL